MEAETEGQLLLRAAAFAARAYHQMRNSSLTHECVEHSIRVARHLQTLGGVTDPNVIAAGLLHDMVEGTNVLLFDIDSAFGSTIAGLVAEVSDDRRMSRVECQRAQVAHVPHMTTEARLIKLADMLDNLSCLRELQPWTPVLMQGYVAWARKMYLAGLQGVSRGLDRRMEALFQQTFERGGVAHPMLPAGDLDEAVEAYYESIIYASKIQ